MTMVVEDEKSTDEIACIVDTMYQKALDIFTRSAKVAVELGDSKRLMQVLYFHLANDTLPPEWARDELCAAYDAEGLDVQSWDDVFGKPPGGKTKRQVKEEIAYFEGKRLHGRAGHKIADDSDLFPELGKILGVSAGMAKEYYYGYKKRRGAKRGEGFHGLVLQNVRRKNKAGLTKEHSLLLRKALRVDRLIEASKDVCDENIARISGKTTEQIADDLLLASKAHRALYIDIRKRTYGKSVAKTRINKSVGSARRK
jgi:hypothetical protein